MLMESQLRMPSARERVCDLAAERIANLVIGLPVFHPLRTDRDLAIKTMKGMLDQCNGRFRLLTRGEQAALGIFLFDPAFAPEFKPLGRAATAADVVAMRAMFHLNGKGQPAGVALPTVVTLRKDDKGNVVSGLAVQAELGPDGIVYGVLFQKGFRAVKAAEVERP